MSRFQIPLADYLKACAEAYDAGYREHLRRDFVISPDGYAVPRVDFVKVNDRTYRERRNFLEYQSRH